MKETVDLKSTIEKMNEEIRNKFNKPRTERVYQSSHVRTSLDLVFDSTQDGHPTSPRTL